MIRDASMAGSGRGRSFLAARLAAYRGQRPRRAFDNLVETARRTPWPKSRAPRAGAPSIALVTVSYNTVELTAHLLFSVLRVLDREAVRRIVVVDNGSTDGSERMLAALADRGLIELLHNRRLPYHGPGLNRAVSHLARTAQDGGSVDLIWTVDTDVVVLRRDALTAAVAALSAAGGALAGEIGGEELNLLPEGTMYLSSMLLDPRLAWRRGVRPFWEHGAPSVGMQRSLRDKGETFVDFPFYRDEYLLHLGQGTVDRLLTRGDENNRYFAWAARPRSYTYHYSGNPNGPALYRRFLEVFSTEVPLLTPEALVAACSAHDALSSLT